MEFGPTETLPPVGAISKHPGVSADAVAKPSAQTRAESRVLDLRKRLRKRDRLSAGGSRIRTLGPTSPGKAFFREKFRVQLFVLTSGRRRWAHGGSDSTRATLPSIFGARFPQ